MNVIFGDNISELARTKYTVLELDTFLVDGQTATAYAIVEKIPLSEITALSHYQDLHANLMREYRNRNWKYCEDAVGYLQGRWSTELDSFYSELHQRIQNLKTQSLDDSWNGTIPR